jgi:hypothetical protein
MGGSLGVAIFGAIFASRLTSELRALPGSAAAHLSGGVNIRPAEVHALPTAVRHDFLLAFVNALQPVFLVGAGVAAVTFVLALLLKEVPLRATMHDPAELAADEAAAGGTGAEAIIAPQPRAALPTSSR